MTNKIAIKQIECGITRTNTKTHKVIADNLKLSAVYSGSIKGSGPRYCPSIEDKVKGFSRKTHTKFF